LRELRRHEYIDTVEGIEHDVDDRGRLPDGCRPPQEASAAQAGRPPRRAGDHRGSSDDHRTASRDDDSAGRSGHDDHDDPSDAARDDDAHDNAHDDGAEDDDQVDDDLDAPGLLSICGYGVAVTCSVSFC
jgi:hypothetical protein